MNKKIAAALMTAAAAHLGGCSKVDVESANNHGSNPAKQVVLSKDEQSSRARIVEIDRLLSAPLTGTPEDSDRRASLRAERTALVNPHGVGRERPAPRLAPPEPTVQNTRIVVARDSQGVHEPRPISGVEAMTPTERERYYKQLRLTNPHVVVPVYTR